MTASDMTVIRAAVIGAGAAGLVMTRHLAPPGGAAGHAHHHLHQSSVQSSVKIIPTVFEMADRVGGTWIYNEQTESDVKSSGVKIHSSNEFISKMIDALKFFCMTRHARSSVLDCLSVGWLVGRTQFVFI